MTTEATKRPPRFFYGHVILGVATLGLFMTGPAQTFGVAVFIEPMRQDLAVSRSLVSGAYSTASALAGVSMLVLGPQLDRFPARWLLSGMAVLYSLACGAMGAVQGPWGLLGGLIALRVLAVGALSLGCSTLAARWFVHYRGWAMSIGMLGLAVSNAIFPPGLQALISASGWRAAWVVCGLLVAASTIVPAAWLVRDRPEAMGLRPDGRAAPEVVGGDGRGTEPDWPPAQVFRTATFWLLVAASVIPGTVMTGLVFHQVSLFAARGLSPAFAASALSLYAVAFALTTLAVGYVLTRVPERWVLVAGSLCLAFTVLWLMVATTPWAAATYGALLGIAFGIGITPGLSLWTAYYGRRHLGSIRGVVQAAMVLCSATGPLMLSLPYDLSGRYDIGLALMVALALAGAVAATLAGPPSLPRGLPTG